MKTVAFLPFLSGLLLTCAIQAAQPAPPQDSFWKKLLKIAGISATPSQMKAGDDDWPAGGQICIADIQSPRTRKLSDESGFRSPVFTPDGEAVLALKSNALWRLPLSGGSARQVRELPQVTKLVGFSQEDPDKLCMLAEQDRSSVVQLLSITTGETIRIEHDPASRDHRRLLTHLKGWKREYGSVHVYPDEQSKTALSGEMTEWTDIFVQRGTQPPINVSNSGGINCAHPSLSSDGNRVVFITIDSKLSTR